MSLEPAHARPNDPSDFVCSSFTPASPRCCPASGCLPCLSFPSSSSVVFWLLIWPETGSQRDITLHQYHAVSLTHLSKNASYSSFLMPPINLQMSSSDRTEGDTGGQRGKRGGGQRGHYRGLFILQGWQKTLKCWGWIMLSNTDCDFFRGKTTVFGKLGVTLTLESSGLLSYCGLTEEKCTSAVHGCPMEQCSTHLKWQVNLKMSAVQSVIFCLFFLLENYVLCMCAFFCKKDTLHGSVCMMFNNTGYND